MIDINPAGNGLSQELSNSTQRDFVFDGVLCTSIQSVLYAFHIENLEQQRKACAQTVTLLMQREPAKNTPKNDGLAILYWNGTSYDRYGNDYQRLLDRLYLAAARGNMRYRQAIFLTGCQEITFSTGSTDPRLTVITADETCRRIVALRKLIAAEQLLTSDHLIALP